jgi:hypothetical protein
MYPCYPQVLKVLMPGISLVEWKKEVVGRKMQSYAVADIIT